MRLKLTATIRSSCILVISPDDRHVELATAPRFSHIFTHEYTETLLRNSFVPSIRRNRLCEGIILTIKAIAASMTATPPAPANAPRNRAKTGRDIRGLLSWALKASLYALLWVILFAGYGWLRDNRCPECGWYFTIKTTKIFSSEYSPDGVTAVRRQCRHFKDE